MDAEQAKAKEIEALQEQLQNLKDMAAGKAVSVSRRTNHPFQSHNVWCHISDSFL